jgi:hypothetical protein
MFDVSVAKTEDFLNVPSLYNIALPPAYSAGARVHSNSWGTPDMNAYTSKSLDVDEFMEEHPDFLFVVAAANDGYYGYNSVGSPGVCKNALTVGAASTNHNNVVSFSSLGYNYDTAIKPDIVAPGRYLMSAGVHTDTLQSCNVQNSSGTSMATPITAGSAILIRHYLENASYWGEYCNSTYRSCPVIVPSATNSEVSTFISGALLKACVIHSAQAMDKYVCQKPKCTIENTDLEPPPNNFEGWGQVMLKNLLPLPGTYNFDLYVADYESLSSMTRRTYYAVVVDTDIPFLATICWSDPANVVWAAKNLLNDLDLMVTSPSGEVFYGNNIQGDEFNPVEKVSIGVPEVGEYVITVTAKQLAVGTSQDYGIVISSHGYVVENKMATSTISYSDIVKSEEEITCGNGNQIIRIQLEDWQMGDSWNNIYVEIDDSSKTMMFNCTFIPNKETDSAYFNRIRQCSACLPDNHDYSVKINSVESPSADLSQIRAVIPQCNIFLSDEQISGTMSLTDSGCNICPSTHSLLEVHMFANVTDDDDEDYTWYTFSSLFLTYVLCIDLLGCDLIVCMCMYI